MLTNNIIVYGTLKEGFSNPLSNYDGKKIKDVVLGGWEMYTNAWYPQVIPGDGIIHAELWEVPEENMDDLDSYECHPSLFKRTPVEIDGIHAEMYVYQRDLTGHFRLHSGVFEKR